jgi:ribose transport system substrate-binding protein
MEKMSRRLFMKNASLVSLAALPLGAIFLEACSASGSSSAPASAAAAPTATSASVTSGAVTGAASAAAASNAATGQKVMIAPPVANNVYWDGYSAAAAFAAAQLGMGSHYTNFNGDTNAQIAAFENAPALGLKGAITMANTAAVAPQLFASAQKNGILTINSWNNQPWTTPPDIGDAYVEYLEISNDRSYEVLADLVFKKLGGTGNVIHVSGVAGNSASEARDAGLKRALAANPGIKLLGEQPGNFSRTDTIPVVENLLTTYPDVQAILCQNDDSALGAITVAKQKGIKPLIVGYDAVPEMIDAIVAGDAFATIANNGPWLGGAAVVRIFDALNGVQLDPLERMMQFESFAISTPDAAKAYKDLFFSPGQFPFDYQRMSRFLHPNDWDMQVAMWTIRPDEYWAGTAKPSGYQLPAGYQNKAEADFGKIDDLYKQHLQADVFDQIIKLTNPVADVRSWK